MLFSSIRAVADSSRVFRYVSCKNYPRFSSSSQGKMVRGKNGRGHSRTPDSSSARESTHRGESVVHKLSMNQADDPSASSVGNEDRLSHIETPFQRKTLPEGEVDNVSLVLPERYPGFPPFDICQTESRGPVKLKTSLYTKNREKRKEQKQFQNGPQPLLLKPGMVFLKNYISHSDQVEIVEKCRKFGIGPGGFYQPGYRDGAKLHLQMMCLGKNWDPQSKLYEDIRPIDGAKPPSIPDKFRQLVEEAIQTYHTYLEGQCGLNKAPALPRMSPDICIINFYTNTGKLGLHQDKDESIDSISKGLPVVSFSVGDSAEFLYGEDRDVDKAEKITLESGDVLIFGGPSRLLYHGVQCIWPKTAPSSLLEETKLRTGHLNLTFRQY